MTTTREFTNAFLLATAMMVGLILTGCDNKETLLDVETPDGGVEVERDRTTGDVSVDVDD